MIVFPDFADKINVSEVDDDIPFNNDKPLNKGFWNTNVYQKDDDDKRVSMP